MFGISGMPMIVVVDSSGSVAYTNLVYELMADVVSYVSSRYLIELGRWMNRHAHGVVGSVGRTVKVIRSFGNVYHGENGVGRRGTCKMLYLLLSRFSSLVARTEKKTHCFHV
jgi:hypothetical protein